MTLGIIGIIVLGAVALVQSIRLWAGLRLIARQRAALTLAAEAISMLEERNEVAKSGLIEVLAACGRQDVDGMLRALDRTTDKLKEVRGA